MHTSQTKDLGIFFIGVKLEYGSKQESNNTLVSVVHNDAVPGEDSNKSPLYCSTDKEDCCTDSSIGGYWFLPNGSEVPSSNRQSLYTTVGNQTVGLNVNMDASSDLNELLPRGIYHCEIMDEKNITHYLYVGIYPEDEGNIIISHYATQ